MTSKGGESHSVQRSEGRHRRHRLGLIGYTHAKERLVAQGMDRDAVEKMAVGQVIAIYTDRIYRSFSDDYEKLWYVPFADMHGEHRWKRIIARRSHVWTGEDRELLPIVSLLMPAIQASGAPRSDSNEMSLRCALSKRFVCTQPITMANCPKP